jgi:hypothetical protein
MMTNVEQVLPAVTPAAEVSVDWRLLRGGEIYDRFIQKGAKLGYQANKVIRLEETQEYVLSVVCFCAQRIAIRVSLYFSTPASYEVSLK